jgi:hypothetical protein
MFQLSKVATGSSLGGRPSFSPEKIVWKQKLVKLPSDSDSVLDIKKRREKSD